jgi:hypothetical protein
LKILKIQLYLTQNIIVIFRFKLILMKAPGVYWIWVMVVLTTCIYIDCDGENFYNHLELAVEKILFYTYMYELLGYIQFHRLCAHNLAYAIIQKRNSKNKIFAKSALYNCVQHILCCVVVLFFFVLCTLCCQFLWIVLFWLTLRYSLMFIELLIFKCSEHVFSKFDLAG